MNILIEPGTYDCLNMGDVAMLEVAVQRLSSLWPDATLQMLTREPQALRSYFPFVQPIPEQGRQIWLLDRNILGRLHQVLPEEVSRWLVRQKRSLRERWPGLLRSILEIRLSRSPQDRVELAAFLRAMSNAGVFVVSGQGTLSDLSESHAIRLLDTLDMAVHRGIPTALFGQGLGPMTDPRLIARAKAVFPGVSLIAVREDVAGPPLLASLGVDSPRVLVTGDDAIEISLGDPNRELGRGIGVNIRLTPGTGVDESGSKKVRRAIQAFARSREARLIPVPIAFHAVARDPENIVQLLAGYDDLSDGGQGLTTPSQIIDQTKKCRIVVTVAYHAAVFALSQGVPVICLAQTRYYVDKFVGLKSLFGTGCEIVLLDDENLDEALWGAMTRAWESAEEVRLPLLRAAEHQIEMGRDAYRKFGEMAGATATLEAAPTEGLLAGAFH